MTDAAEFVDAALRYESSPERAESERARLGLPAGLDVYGASVGAVRGTVRDLWRRHPHLDHDAVTALASELWARPVLERRLAAIVVLQARVDGLVGTDLTRIEGFLRTAAIRELVDPLAVDVVGPLVESLTGHSRARAEAVLDRWIGDDPSLARAAILASWSALRAGGGDWDAVVRRVRRVRATGAPEPAQEAVSRLLREVAARRPDLPVPTDL